MELQVHIVGPFKLQNELLASFLQISTGIACKCGQSLDLNTIVNNKAESPSLILLDCQDPYLKTLWASLGTEFKSKRARSFLALFNASLDKRLYREAINRGVRGIFFENDSPGIFAKGVQAILNGEFWFSRDTLTEWLLETKNDPRSQRDIKAVITTREKQILLMIASGTSNGEIADRLCISSHTVKNHLYNIYNKIDVTNRLQASLWATKNF